MNDHRTVLDEILRLVERSPHSAASLTLYLSNLAWNESVGICFPRASCLRFCQSLESENPQLWSELVSQDMDQMIDAMVEAQLAA